MTAPNVSSIQHKGDNKKQNVDQAVQAKIFTIDAYLPDDSKKKISVAPSGSIWDTPYSSPSLFLIISIKQVNILLHHNLAVYHLLKEVRDIMLAKYPTHKEEDFPIERFYIKTRYDLISFLNNVSYKHTL